MSPRLRALFDYAFGILVLVALALLTWLGSDLIHPDASWLIFIALFVFTSTFAVPLGGGFMSLLPLTTISAILILGTLQAGYVVVCGELLFGLLRWLLASRIEATGELSFQGAARLTSANLAIQGFSVLAAGLVYTGLGGQIPLSTFSSLDLLRIVATVMIYLVVNYSLISIYMLLRGFTALRKFLSTLTNLMLFEGLPIVFAPLMALIHAWLGLQWMTIFALNLAIASLIARSLALASERLEGRVKELNTLQAVGQALAATLHLETVLKEIHHLISELMPADIFYVSLYDSHADLITFPLVIENGKEIQWNPRHPSTGLTEYVLQSRKPVLISRKVKEQLSSLGVKSFGKGAESWLGAPMMVGDEVIGILAVQSYTKPDVYTPAFEKVLATIASQAAMAIQNARLYARIDETLERRVRELNSILQTTADGIVLFDTDRKILTANESLGEMLGIAAESLQGKSLDEPVGKAEETLPDLLGFPSHELNHDLALLADGMTEATHQLIRRMGFAFRRVLTPVKDRDGIIGGWLLVLSDRTEEQELERMRDDMLHMIVHDLRAPLTTLMGSLAMLRENSQASSQSEGVVFYDIAERGGKRMLSLINTILETSRLESGSWTVTIEPLAVEETLREVADQFRAPAQEAQLTFVIEVSPNLPRLLVDGELIARVIYNLVDNAIKFSPEHGIVRLIACHAPEPGYLELSVVDQGKGISPDILPLLFNKFQRDRQITSRRNGTGLGLFFCRLAVEAHGGKIWVESQLEKGSTFKIILPAEQKGH